MGNKEVVVDIDSDEAGLWFLQLRIKDANELYSISERSLGFQWFFAFLLLTQYRGSRAKAPKDVLFLFDEPASNLHPSAQTQLLESFGRFPERSSIIYTTHSHHLINPKWLEGTFVVRNEGLDYDKDADQYTARNTNIALDKYRTFANQHPNKVTYIQPILDVLDYSPTKLENVPDVVMVEGKNDFYTLKYFQDKVLRRKTQLNLLPGNGVSTLDSVIRLYIAWGRNFIILLDSDSAGKDAKRRYEENFGTFVQNRIYLLEDIEPTWKQKDMESIFEDADRMTIQLSAFPTSPKFNKIQFNRGVQELYLKSQVPSISQVTRDNLTKILNFCEQKLEQ
jgi:predicted ATP-dependent endonuclease of OLD family